MQSADVNAIVEYILEAEGGYSNRATDAGGETNFGISKRFNPDVDVKNLTREAAAELWRTRYVDRWALDLFPQRIADKLTDLLAPRNNITEAVEVLQRALWACTGQRLAVDGVAGPLTMNRLWAQCRTISGELQLVGNLRCEIAAQYRLLVARNPAQQPNLNGWLNRSYS